MLHGGVNGHQGCRGIIGAPAEPALLVFGAIVTAMLPARLPDESGRPVRGTSYITPFGLEKKTSLPRDVIEAAGRLNGRSGPHPSAPGRVLTMR